MREKNAGTLWDELGSLVFLHSLVSLDISWTDGITAVVKKAQQWRHVLTVPRTPKLDSSGLHSLSLESLLMCVCVAEGKRVQRAVLRQSSR